MKEYQLIGEGRNRQVWRRPGSNYVVKIPKNTYGIRDNTLENFRYKNSLNKDTYAKYAKCRLKGIILFMEYAQYPGPFSDASGYIAWTLCPAWASTIDCCQVGYNSKMEIVAYDYGD